MSFLHLLLYGLSGTDAEYIDDHGEQKDECHTDVKSAQKKLLFQEASDGASSAGRPAVAFDIDGPGEEIIPEETGLTVPPFDPVKFADALERLAQDGSFRASCGEKAARFASTSFDAETNAHKVFALYTALGL